MALMCLVYVSTALVPPDGDELRALLAQSRQANTGAGITGLLLYHEARFMQSLEGEARAVLDLYARIARDPRHRDVTTMLKFSIRQRYFADWSMGFRDIGALLPAETEGLSDFLDRPLTAEAWAPAPHQAIRLLQRFREMSAQTS